MDTATRLEIHELLARSAYALEERDLAMLKTQTDKRRHVTTHTMVVAEASRAASLVSNVTITAVEHGAIRRVTSGLYRDRVCRETGRWMLAERRIDLDMAY